MTTDSSRSLNGRIAALSMWAQTSDWSARSLPGRQAAWDRFERQVDPNNELPEPERLKRADAARRAHFSRLAKRSAEVRRRRKDE